MKRFLLTAGLAAALMVSSVATAKEYKRVPFEPRQSQSESVVANRQTSPLRAYRQAHGLAETRISPVSPLVQTARMMPSSSRNSKGLFTRAGYQGRGTLFADITWYNGMEYLSDAYWAEINTQTGKVSKLFSSAALMMYDYDLQGGAVRDGLFYTTNLTDDVNWNVIDISNGDVLPPVSFGSDMGGCAYTMTYNPETDQFWCMSFSTSTGDYIPAFYIVEGSDVQPGQTAIPTFVKTFADRFIAALAYCPVDGLVYGFDAQNNMFTIDEDGEISMVANLDYPRILFDEMYGGQCVYSPLDRAFVAYHRNSDQQQMQLVYINYDKLDCTEGPVMDAIYYASAIYCPDAYAVPDAPAKPAEPTFSFVKDALSGTINIVVPTELYCGDPITASTVDVEVLVDGKSFYTGSLAPGASKSIDITKEQGHYPLDYYCSIDGKESPVTTIILPVGNDNPQPVTDLKLTDLTLSWTAPGEVGAYGGYVDTSALTYNVYFDDEKVNKSPITETSYEFTAPSKQKMRTISVVATANGQSSEPTSIDEIIGMALTIPVYLEPNAEEASSFVVIDANDDETAFNYQYNKTLDLSFFGISNGALVGSFNDWLILPKTDFSDTEALYNFSFTFFDAGVYDTGHPLEILIGDKPLISSMKETLYSIDNLTSKEPASVSFNFGVKEGGNKYIAFHLQESGAAYGIGLCQFKIEKVGQATVPGAATLTITAAPQGELKALFSAVLPTKTINGAALDADKDVSLTIEGGVEKVVLTGKPGATVTGEVAVAENGYNRFSHITSNEDGEGTVQYQKVYVGLDTPLAPTNIKATPSDDNLSVTLTWDAPGEVGENGGYVDMSKVTYNVYTVYGISYTELNKKPITETSFTYTPEEPTLSRITIGPTAINEIGESKNSKFVGVQVGQPWGLPISEYFNTSGFSLYPWNFNANGTEFMNCSAQVYFNIGEITFNQGGLYCYNENDYPTVATLYIPKFETYDSQRVTFGVRYYDYSLAPKMSVYATSPNHPTRVHIADITPANPVKGEFKDVEVALGEEFENLGWVALELDFAMGTNSDQLGLVDVIKVYQNIDYDLKLESLEGITTARIGDNVQMHATVVNNGMEPIKGTLRTELLDENGKRLALNDFDVLRLTAGLKFQKYFTFEMLPEYAGHSKLTIRATVISDKDEIAANNELTHELLLSEPVLPVVYDLRAEWDGQEHNSAQLTWSDPQKQYGGYDDFELYMPFQVTSKIGRWKNIDEDKNAVFAIDGLRWENDDQPQAWHVFNAEQLGVMEDDRLAPHSGKQFLMARQSYNADAEDESDLYPGASKWLISPEIVGGTELSFWISSLNTAYTEYVYLYYSKTDDNLESFEKVRSFSKYGEAAWEFVSVTLPEDAKYFALVYKSIDSMAALLDDINFTPAELDTWVIDHYTVWRHCNADWSDFECIADNLTTPSYVDANLGDKTAYYNVTAHVYYDGRGYSGPKSNLAFVATTGVDDDFAELQGVYGDKGRVVVEGHANQQVALYTSDGKIAKVAVMTSDSDAVAADAGVYIVKVGNSYTKVFVR